VKTSDGGHQISGLVDCAATLDFVCEDFVRRFALQTRKSTTKNLVRLANGQRVTSSTVYDVTFELALLNHANIVSVEDNIRKRSYSHSPANGTVTATTSLHAWCRDNRSVRAVA
jgi:hypothetical protein